MVPVLGKHPAPPATYRHYLGSMEPSELLPLMVVADMDAARRSPTSSVLTKSFGWLMSLYSIAQLPGCQASQPSWLEVQPPQDAEHLPWPSPPWLLGFSAFSQAGSVAPKPGVFSRRGCPPQPRCVRCGRVLYAGDSWKSPDLFAARHAAGAAAAGLHRRHHRAAPHAVAFLTPTGAGNI